MSSSETTKNLLNFDLPREHSHIIKVVGVGGGGSNAVNHMYNLGIKGVDFIVCNTDAQALDMSPVPIKIQLGGSLTAGRGAGSMPEVGRNAAIENIDEITTILQDNTVMLFVTAGMGGGTGTGAAPVIAKKARELGILTVGIVTLPFAFEGKRRREQAEAGIRSMREAVDTLLIIRNERLREIHGNLSMKTAFSKADDILAMGAKGIAELISVTGFVNVDMNDVIAVMKNSGVALMGQASAEGEERAIEAVRAALESPLLNDNEIRGAKNILLNITYGDEEVMMDEIGEITDYVQEAAGSTADVIFGYGIDESLGKKLSVTVIATGFESRVDTGLSDDLVEKPVYRALDVESPREVTAPVRTPFDVTESTEKTAERSTWEPFLKESDAKENSASRDAATTTPSRNTEREEYAQPAQAAPQAPEPFLKPAAQPKPQATPEVAPRMADGGEDYKAAFPQRERTLDAEDFQRRAAERNQRMRDVNRRMQTPSGLAELESEPAFRRRNVQLDNVPHSSESNVSRYSLTEEEDENGERKTGLRPNNPYLFDNVD